MSRSRTTKRKMLLLLTVFLAGVSAVVALKFVVYKSDEVHYHANFALYINGKRETFDNFTYYEEVQACVDHSADNPRVRVHMHDRNNGLIHVHDQGVTWGAFFSNLGFILGDSLVKTSDTLYQDTQDDKQLRFILNGQAEISITNRIIKSGDRLLIDYGLDSSKTLQERFSSVPSDAIKANSEHDPASCSGGHELTFWERLRAAVL